MSLAAERYARALFELAGEKDVLDQVGESLLAIRSTLQGDADLAKKFFALRVPEAEKRRLADEKLLGSVQPLVRNLVCLLIDRRREGLLWSLMLAFFEMREEAEGILKVSVESARPMDEEAQSALTEKLSSATGKTVMATIIEDPELIGGLRLTVGSTRIDGSLQRSLERLGDQLRAAV